MLIQFRIATLLLLVLTGLTGVIYPLTVTVIAQTIFPKQANGSLIRVGNDVVGSELIGQQFTQPIYFWGRLSATGPVPYNAGASSGSNFGPLNPALQAAAQARVEALQKAGTPTGKAIPVDLVTASASGLDPHISLAAAEFQIPRIAAARNMSESAIQNLVRRHTTRRQLGLLGEPTVNVLQLNRELDGGVR